MRYSVILEPHIAFGDIRGLFHNEGRLRDVKKLEARVAAQVSSIEFLRARTRRDGEDHTTEQTVKVRTWDKVRALELLAKCLGLLKEQLHLTVGDEIEKRLEAGRQRAAANNAK